MQPHYSPTTNRPAGMPKALWSHLGPMAAMARKLRKKGTAARAVLIQDGRDERGRPKEFFVVPEHPAKRRKER